jgi:hypothetical protein
MPFVFSQSVKFARGLRATAFVRSLHVEYCDMDFPMAMHVLLLKNTKRRFPARRIPFRSELTWIHQTLRDTGPLPCVPLQSEREDVRMIYIRENILEMVQRFPPLSTGRMASRMGISRMQVWRTLQDEKFYPCHDQRIEPLAPGDHAQRLDLHHWVQAHPKLITSFYSLMRHLLPVMV